MKKRPRWLESMRGFLAMSDDDAAKAICRAATEHVGLAPFVIENAIAAITVYAPAGLYDREIVALRKLAQEVE